MNFGLHVRAFLNMKLGMKSNCVATMRRREFIRYNSHSYKTHRTRNATQPLVNGTAESGLFKVALAILLEIF